MDAKTQYQTELKRSEQEHHQPTAGAMIGHVTANLWLHQLKIEQVRLFAKGPVSLFMDQYGLRWQNQEEIFFQQLNQALVSENELVPTTTEQLIEFSMLAEDGAKKYLDGSEQLFDLLHDFDTQLLFITRAIKLAQVADHYGEAELLIKLASWIKKQTALGQRFLGHELNEGLYNEEDDDE